MPEARSGRPLSATNATLQVLTRLTCCVLASWIADHQQGRAVRRIYQAVALKAGFRVGAHRAAIVRIRIGHDAGNSRSQQGVSELPDEAGAMTAPDHIGLADELVDAPRGGWMRAKPLVPGAERITLDVAERMVAKSDNELVHIRMIEIAAHQRVLLVRLSPPTRHLRRFEPPPDQ